MSFDLYVQSFRNGASWGVSRQRIREVFGSHLTEVQPNYWTLRYDGATFCNLDLTAHDDETMVEGFSVHRPCGDERLWEALASVLGMGNIVLYFPGGRAPLVASSGVTEHLPPDLIEALGQPLVVTSGSEIQREIHMA